MMRRLALAAALLMLAPAIVQAQSAMDVQRLIWRCNAAANSDGLRGKVREARVQKCIDEGEAAMAGSRPAAAGPAEAGDSATLTGELSYPSDHIPADMRICALSLATREAHCTTRKTRRGRATRYTLKVPPGSYHVYATTAEWSGPPAYYSEFVTCGAHVNCPSHKPITVAVKAGERRDGVHPGDWYAQ